jgi:hypothetical protein
MTSRGTSIRSRLRAVRTIWARRFRAGEAGRKLQRRVCSRVSGDHSVSSSFDREHGRHAEADVSAGLSSPCSLRARSPRSRLASLGYAGNKSGASACDFESENCRHSQPPTLRRGPAGAPWQSSGCHHRSSVSQRRTKYSWFQGASLRDFGPLPGLAASRPTTPAKPRVPLFMFFGLVGLIFLLAQFRAVAALD